MPATPRVTPWTEARPPDEAELRRRYAEEGLAPYRWSNGPGYVYGDHSHPYHKVLYCLAGSIRFTLPASGGALDLRPGDRLDLPAGTVHGALVGPEGVVCLEAARPPERG